MQVDYIIIGQGLSGTFLSRNLLKTGFSVLVIDESKPFTASKVASGVINPITGRRMVRTWEIETLMPYAVEAYTSFGKELNESLIRKCNILDFHPTPQMKIAFEERYPVEKEYLRLPADENEWQVYFNYHFGFGEIDPCWLIDLNTLLNGWRKELQNRNALLEENFRLEDCVITADQITYQNITAKKIFFCDGVSGFDNPYFKMLPYARNKGEALIVDIPGLPNNHIFKQGINIVPWSDGFFWVGSSYEWEFADSLPSALFRKKIEDQLRYWLKLPYRVVDHIASERPANMERRPFAGLHPVMPSVGILNGFGTKGCTLAPYFSAQLTDFLVSQKPIQPLVDVRRFTKILSR
jgi:glycine/D-amino acid oxidase-like deaminating enzyme